MAKIKQFELGFVPITAHEANERGFTRYFTGKECKNGHTAPRMTRNGACVECMRTSEKRYRARHPETHAKASAKYRSRNIEVIRKRDAKLHATARKRYPEKERASKARHYQRKEQALFEIAGRPRPDSCELCGESAQKIVFDHCHARGHFRGWLCDRCNRVLGSVRDSPAILAKMIQYLTREIDGQIDKQAKELTAG